MTTRRNFLKNTALTTAAITIPGTAIASVDNWAKMEPKFYSPIYVPVDWQLPQSVEDINKIEFINQFDVPILCTDIIDGKPIIIPEEYYIDDMKCTKTKFLDGYIYKHKIYACMNIKHPHNLISFKDAQTMASESFVVIPTFIIAVKEKCSYTAFFKIENFIKQEINSFLNKPFGLEKQKPDYAKLVISQSFNKYDMIYHGDRKYEQDGAQYVDYMEENHKSEFYAMRIGITGFNNEQSMA